MTKFEELAMKVAEDTWGKGIYPQSTVDFANRLREEWVKQLEPVAWMKTNAGNGNECAFIPNHVKQRGYDDFREPLYTLEELKK